MCDYMCTLPYGHPQAEHDTFHGSVLETRWALDGADDVALEIDGHKFGANETGAPMYCGSVCETQGRHVHIDYCKAHPGSQCTGGELEHLAAKISPHPDRPKDAISHALFWKRTGAHILWYLFEVLTSLVGFKGSWPAACFDATS